MGELVRGSRPIQPVLRKFRQPLYDEEKIGNGTATALLTLFARRRGEADMAGHVKTARDTNMIANGQLGAKQEFYMVGFNVMLDWCLLLVDKQSGAPGNVLNEMYVIEQIMNDSLFTFTFGRAQPLLEIPLERIPYGMGPDGAISTNRTAGVPEVAHMITNGLPSVREFFDVRLKKTRPRHIQPEQAFTVEISWPNGAITIGTDSGNEYYRIMVYIIGVMLASI